ncbi:uncharacterized protein LOC141651564 [Silene latifolia]|uniref:uncharacterized protein LOC141651564 n=1 Tax=Silene latifolia TaxID=37657 RepID=UPI003D77B50C
MERRGSYKDKNRIGDRGREFCKKKLWHLLVPRIWKILVWKILTNTLPIGVEFEKRKLAIDSFCCMCGEDRRKVESAEHLFRDCEISSRIWAGSELGIRVENAGTINITDWIIDWIRYLYSRKEGERSVIIFVAILWGLWNIRNNIIFKGMTTNPQILANCLYKSVNENVRILSDHVEGKDMHWIIREGHEELSTSILAEIREGNPVRVISTQGKCEVVRVKVDASWGQNYEAAVGWVAYDCTGKEIIRRQIKARAESALQAEALGVREVLIWAHNSGILHLDISSACLQLINQIAGVEKENHLIKYLLENLRELYASYHCLCFNFIPRHLNTVAQSIAISFTICASMLSLSNVLEKNCSM